MFNFLFITLKNTLKDLVQFSLTVVQSCLTLCNPMDCSKTGFPVHHKLPKLAQTHFHWVGDAIQLSHPLLSPSPPAFTLSQHQGLFKWVRSLYQVVKELKLQLQHQSFQWLQIVFKCKGWKWPIHHRASNSWGYQILKLHKFMLNII